MRMPPILMDDFYLFILEILPDFFYFVLNMWMGKREPHSHALDVDCSCIWWGLGYEIRAYILNKSVKCEQTISEWLDTLNWADLHMLRDVFCRYSRSYLCGIGRGICVQSGHIKLCKHTLGGSSHNSFWRGIGHQIHVKIRLHSAPHSFQWRICGVCHIVENKSDISQIPHQTP